MNAPHSSPPPRKDALWIGFLAGWAILLFGGVLVLPLFYAARAFGLDAWVLSPVLSLVQPLLIIVTAVLFYRRGMPRAAGGVFLAVASLIALVLLLVAACFGIFALAN